MTNSTLNSNLDHIPENPLWALHYHADNAATCAMSDVEGAYAEGLSDELYAQAYEFVEVMGSNVTVFEMAIDVDTPIDEVTVAEMLADADAAQTKLDALLAAFKASRVGR